MNTAVIVDAVRTPLGKSNGALRDWHPVDLAAETLTALVDRNGLDPIGNELRPKSKGRSSAKDDPIVEANLERTPVPYSVRDSYFPGDRISHPKLGEGVVEKALGPNKVEIRFGDECRVLVQGRS